MSPEQPGCSSRENPVQPDVLVRDKKRCPVLHTSPGWIPGRPRGELSGALTRGRSAKDKMDKTPPTAGRSPWGPTAGAASISPRKHNPGRSRKEALPVFSTVSELTVSKQNYDIK